MVLQVPDNNLVEIENIPVEEEDTLVEERHIPVADILAVDTLVEERHIPVADILAVDTLVIEDDKGCRAVVL